MSMQNSGNLKTTAIENSRFATLPTQLQRQIRRCLEMGDFKTAKALFDDGLKSKDKH